MHTLTYDLVQYKERPEDLRQGELGSLALKPRTRQGKIVFNPTINHLRQIGPVPF